MCYQHYYCYFSFVRARFSLVGGEMPVGEAFRFFASDSFVRVIDMKIWLGPKRERSPKHKLKMVSRVLFSGGGGERVGVSVSVWHCALAHGSK